MLALIDTYDIHTSTETYIYIILYDNRHTHPLTYDAID